MNESIQSRFAFRLKEMRENRNLSQAALSKRLSISQSTVAPYLEVTPFEKTIVEAYRGLSTAEQVIVCRSLGLMHPAESRVKANRA